MKKEDVIKGGKADKLTLSDIADKHGVSIEKLKKELEVGKKIESEHTDSEQEQEEITMDHLVEDPEYYTNPKTGLVAKEIEKEVEPITEYARRMRQLCGLEVKEGFNTMQNSMNSDDSNVDTYSGPNYVNVSAAGITQPLEEKKDDDNFTVFKFEQKNIEKGNDDDTLYPLANQ